MGEVIPIHPPEPVDLTKGVVDEFKDFAASLTNPPKETE